MSLDSVTLAVLKGRFEQIADEMDIYFDKVRQIELTGLRFRTTSSFQHLY